jgi:hypothetical protein
MAAGMPRPRATLILTGQVRREKSAFSICAMRWWETPILSARARWLRPRSSRSYRIGFVLLSGHRTRSGGREGGPKHAHEMNAPVPEAFDRIDQAFDRVDRHLHTLKVMVAFDLALTVVIFVLVVLLGLRP